MSKLIKAVVLGSALIPALLFAAITTNNKLVNGNLNDTVAPGATVDFSFQYTNTSSEDAECVTLEYPTSGEGVQKINISDVTSTGNSRTIHVIGTAPMQEGQDYDPRIKVYGVDGVGQDQLCTGSVRSTVNFTNQLNVEEEDFTPVPPTGGGDDECDATVDQNLSYGMRNNEVKDLQVYLISHGYSTLPTGYFGPMTLAAVNAFQQARLGFHTGYVGSLTRAQINADACHG